MNWKLLCIRQRQIHHTRYPNYGGLRRLAHCLPFYARKFYKEVMKAPRRERKMISIATHVTEGAYAYLKQQYKVVGIFFYRRISCPSLNFLWTTLPIKGSAFCILNQWFPVRTCRFPWYEDSHQRQFKDG